MDKNKVLEALVKANVLRFGEFTLVSGEKSPIYVDLRVLPSNPESFDIVTSALAEVVKKLDCDVIAGMETAGIPLSSAMAIKLKKPMVYVRKKPKDYGTHSRIEGNMKNDGKLVLVDDLVTRGTSKVDFIKAVRDAGNEVKDLVIVLDREQGGEDVMVENGIELHKLVTLKELLSYMVDKGFISHDQYSEVLVYLGE
jgi:orotate phosphoribosyltransferase